MAEMGQGSADASLGGGASAAKEKAKGLVLIVDDEEYIRVLLQQLLEIAGFETLVAGDGDEALEAAEAHDGPIRLLLTDVMMPRMGGGELASRLRVVRPDIRILYISAYNEDATVLREVREGVAEFLAKPFNRKALMQKLEQVLG